MSELLQVLQVLGFVGAAWWGSLRVMRHLDRMGVRLQAVEEKTGAMYEWWLRHLIERGEDPLPFINAAKLEKERKTA